MDRGLASTPAVVRTLGKVSWGSQQGKGGGGMKSCHSAPQPLKMPAVVVKLTKSNRSIAACGFPYWAQINGPPVRRKEEWTVLLASSLLHHDNFRAFFRGLKAVESGPHWSESQKVENLDSLHSPTNTTKTITASKIFEAASCLLFWMSQGIWHTLKTPLLTSSLSITLWQILTSRREIWLRSFKLPSLYFS